MSLEEQQELEESYVMHTFGRKPVEFVRGSGMVLEDDKGREYLDFIAGIGDLTLGHCHPAVVRALQQQAEKLIHVSNYYYIEGRGEVARRLSDLLNHGAPAGAEPWQSFFANSGAEAKRSAPSSWRAYTPASGRRRGPRRRGREDEARAAASAAPRVIVTLDRSFHGRTMATLAATAQPAKQEAFQPLPDGFAHTPLNDVAALEALFAERGNEICAVMVECVQGEGGVHPCTSEFLQAARRLTEERGALLMCDECRRASSAAARRSRSALRHRARRRDHRQGRGLGHAHGHVRGPCRRGRLVRSRRPRLHVRRQQLGVAAAQATLRPVRSPRADAIRFRMASPPFRKSLCVWAEKKPSRTRASARASSA